MLVAFISGCSESFESGIGLLGRAESKAPAIEPSCVPEDFTEEQIAAAKKHPAFSKLTEADLILIGKSTFRLEGVLESFPAQYQYRVSVKVDLALPGEIEKGKTTSARLSITSKVDPEVPSGKTCVVALKGRRRPYIVFHAESSEKLIRVAKIAHLLKTNALEDGLKKAKDHPQKHALYKQLDRAKGVAIVHEDTNPTATVEFDVKSQRSITGGHVDFVFKGKLERGQERKMAFENGQPKIESGDLFLITYSIDDKLVQVDKVIAITDETRAIITALYKKQLSAEDKKALASLLKQKK